MREIRSPLTPEGAGLVSADGKAVLVQFELEDPVEESKERIEDIAAAIEWAVADHDAITVSQFGEASVQHALDETVREDFQRAEILALPVTLLVLFVSFGSLVAAGLPVVLGFSAVLATFGLNELLSHLVPTATQTESVILLIGMAVGVDYSLFYLRRYREERARGHSVSAALEVTAATSGQAVLVSGATVVVAMAGMLLAGLDVFTSIGIGTMLVVAVAVLGSTTVLPALLRGLGDSVERGRLPLRRRSEPAMDSRFWSWLVERVVRRRLLWFAAGTAALVALTVPALGMQTSSQGLNNLPRDLEVVQAKESIDAAFPGSSDPALVAIAAPNVRDPEVAAAVDELVGEALASGAVAKPVRVETSADEGTALLTMPLAGDGTQEGQRAALETLRQDVIPATLGEMSGVEVAVGGQVAHGADFDDRVASRAPLVALFVLGLAFVLLLASFRSLGVAILTTILTLLSVGASYGLLVLIFQGSWAEGILGFESSGAVASWLPLFMFVVVFGLAMDYNVFILSRIRELVQKGLSTQDAVVRGISSTSATVTSAAAVMVAVFAIFATLESIDLKQLGVGLGLAVLLDATIIRSILLPAGIALLGERAWWMPRWLAWLPSISIEGRAPSEELATAPTDWTAA